MKFGTWIMKSLYRAGLLMMVVKELPKYKLDLVEVQEIRWDRSGTKSTGKYAIFYGRGNKSLELGSRFSVHKEQQQLKGYSLLVTGCHTYRQ
jgi:hypothetical protein